MLIRVIKIAILTIMAAFFTIITYDNIIDYSTSFLFVKHVLSMDDTFKATTLMSRAITNETSHYWAYNVIIFTEGVTAFTLWVSVFLLAKNIKQYAAYVKYKSYAQASLFLGFALYFVGFLIIGGEWFAMWQSNRWSGQQTAGLFISVILLIMLFNNSNENEA